MGKCGLFMRHLVLSDVGWRMTTHMWIERYVDWPVSQNRLVLPNTVTVCMGRNPCKRELQLAKTQKYTGQFAQTIVRLIRKNRMRRPKLPRPGHDAHDS